MKKKGAGKKGKGKAALTLGPLFFHWDAEKRRDFYFRIADEADVDVVYLGEVVCSKREPLFDKYENNVIRRLQKAGKQVVLSTLAMVTTPREMQSIARKAKSGLLIEANDVATVQVLGGKPFVAGPFINVFNEGSRDYLARLGVQRIVFASEMSGEAIGKLLSGKHGKSSSPSPCGRVEIASRFRGGVKKENPSPAKTKGLLTQAQVFASSPSRGEGPFEYEIQVFGRQPLSVSMRCYAARAYGRNKDSCRFACGNDPDGLPVDSIDGQPVLSVFGTGTMSHGYVVLLREMKKLQKQGASHFRLSPQNVDMVKVAALYRAVLEGKKNPDSALDSLRKITGFVPFINGFFHGREGLAWVK
jgi:O2-independent ubiquinone biosynthesis protein UbiV